MGVRTVTIFKDLNGEGKPVYVGEGQGGCTAYFTSLDRIPQIAKGRSMTVAFDKCFANGDEDLTAFFASPMIQSLVPGTRYVGNTSSPARGTIFVPYGDLPGDQVACVLRLAKQIIYGNYNTAIKLVRTRYPGVSAEVATVMGAFIATSYIDSDGAPCFGGYTIAEAQDYGITSLPLYSGDVLPLLQGITRPGQQLPFRTNGYFKAGYLAQYYNHTSVQWEGIRRTSPHLANFGPDSIPSVNAPIVSMTREGVTLQCGGDTNLTSRQLFAWLDATGNAPVHTPQPAQEAAPVVAPGPVQTGPALPASAWDNAPVDAQRALLLAIGAVCYIRVDAGRYYHQAAGSRVWSRYASQALGAERWASATPRPTPAVGPTAPVVDWSTAPAGAQRAILLSQFATRFIKRRRSSSSGEYVYSLYSVTGRWARYRSQSLGQSDWLQAAINIRPVTRRATASATLGDWDNAPAGATHWDRSRWLRDLNGTYSFWDGIGWIEYAWTAGVHLRGAEPRPTTHFINQGENHEQNRTDWR